MSGARVVRRESAPFAPTAHSRGRGRLRLAAIFLAACVSASPEAQKVRVTNNPEVVRGCKFLGNVKAMSGWGGAAGSGTAAHNIEETLKERAHQLGANVVYIISNAASKGTGEAYRCEGEALK